MSGVWVFKNGVIRLVENPAAVEPANVGTGGGGGGGQALSRQSLRRRKVLVHTPSNEVITCYSVLEEKLLSVGWERYYDDPDHLLQFHKRSTVHLISLPKDFSKFKSVHMYDIVVKTHNIFQVRDM
ncbi:hypothetical protein BVC80_1395g16 [Macleaya cordata]|uniref:Flowering-promoting factor 1-like protein 3 n=1 Tax=Macleaya cordata TaxID=56857 RepID=A0A200Q1G0_MACCD|nr:hypothetical protein BVC80_1395g16 [Macleaya cordata]